MTHDPYTAVVAALSKLTPRADMDPDAYSGLLREQAGRIWLTWAFARHNEHLRSNIAAAFAEIDMLGDGHSMVLSWTAVDAFGQADGDIDGARELLRQWRESTGKTRPQAHRARWVVSQAAGVFHELTGEPAPRTRDGQDAGRATGALVILAEDLFRALGIYGHSASRHVQTFLAETAKSRAR